MCVILMNLIIGLAISNIQDLKQNADGFRLVKEVLLQRYMESLLRIAPRLPQSWRQESGLLHQLVSKDIYNGNAFYCFDMFAVDSVETNLALVRKLESGSLAENTTMASHTTKKITEIPIPLTVVSKLKHVQEKNAAKQTENYCDVKQTVNEIKREFQAFKTTILAEIKSLKNS